MSDQTSTTSMHDWMRSGWRIVPGDVLAESKALTPPAPLATRDIFNERDTLEDRLQEQHDSMWDWELMEDLADAQQALEEYEAVGIEGTIPYSEYRAERLGSKYRV